MSTEDTTPKGQAALIEAFSVGYKLRDAGADYAGEPAHAYTVPEDMRLAREAHVERHRAAVRTSLQQQAATLTGEDRSQVDQNILALDGAATIGAIDTLAAGIRREIAVLVAISSDSPLLMEDAARSAQRSLSAAHYRLYASDAIYRTQMDALATEANNDRKEADDRDRNIDAMLRDHGIATGVDDELEEQRRRRAVAEQRGDTIETLRLDVTINQLRERQLAEAHEQAEEQGKTELVEALGQEQPQRKRETEAAARRQETAMHRLLEARERELKREGLSGGALAEAMAAEKEQVEVVRDDAMTETEEAPRNAVKGKEARPDQKDGQPPASQGTPKLPVIEVTELPASPSPSENVALRQVTVSVKL